MAENSFGHMVKHLENSSYQTLNKHVSHQDYDEFCRDYVWMALKGKSFGVEFCKRFGCLDVYLLVNTTNTENCDQHIRTMYIK